MSWSVLLGFFDQVVPLGTVALLVWMAVMSRDIKHLGHNIADIKENLTNHITDTNKKIEKNTDKLEAKIEKNTDKLEKNTEELRAGQAKLSAKLDQLLSASK